ncbi:MAG: 4Fe-4S binding protein [Burkholderiaceae bacterium]|nr:4Fe-4S binding protein [Burkholderiaceae bacterium]
MSKAQPDGMPVARCAEIDSARCVHARIEIASCHACQDACPRAALTLTDDALTLDTGRCDGCGLCLPACPEAAIRVGDKPPLRRLQDGGLAILAACEKSGLAGAGVVPCLHALGVSDLLAAARNGARDWLLAHPDCRTCGRGQAAGLSTALACANALLADRGRHAMLVTRLPPDAWDSLRAATRDPKATATVSRRAFFRTLVSEASQTLADAGSGIDPAPRFVPPGALLPEGDGRLPWCIILDAAECTGCDACVRSCPHAAITLGHQPECYRLHARQCTGCGVCVDVCEAGAVKLAAFARPEQHSLALRPGRCRACGSPFHVPHEKTGELCPVCSRVNHPRLLFQVID